MPNSVHNCSPIVNVPHGGGSGKRQWLGATIKNLVGKAEMSAAGMGRETGVLLLEVPPDSAAAKAAWVASRAWRWKASWARTRGPGRSTGT